MRNDDRAQRFEKSEVTLKQIEDMFPLMKFLNKATADPKRFINKEEQKKPSIAGASLSSTKTRFGGEEVSMVGMDMKTN